MTMRIPSTALIALTITAFVHVLPARSQYGPDCAIAMGIETRLRDSLLERAWSAFEGGNKGVAYEMRTLRQAIDAGPPPEERWIVFTQVFSGLNQPDSAITLLEESVTRWSTCSGMWVARSRMLMNYHRNALAIRAADEATQQFREDAYVWGASAEVVYRAGDRSMAARYLRRAIVLDRRLLTTYPDFRSTYDSLVQYKLIPRTQ
jgi:tetratricopeptide (TPR) repeat protein